MKYTKPDKVEHPGYYDPEGEAIHGFVTERIDPRTTFGEAVVKLVLKVTDRTYGNPEVLMTTRDHWSGYSEYTITNEWSEIVLTVPEWNFELAPPVCLNVFGSSISLHPGRIGLCSS
jgi:hypothetical protein